MLFYHFFLVSFPIHVGPGRASFVYADHKTGQCLTKCVAVLTHLFEVIRPQQCLWRGPLWVSPLTSLPLAAGIPRTAGLGSCGCVRPSPDTSKDGGPPPLWWPTAALLSWCLSWVPLRYFPNVLSCHFEVQALQKAVHVNGVTGCDRCWWWAVIILLFPQCMILWKTTLRTTIRPWSSIKFIMSWISSAVLILFRKYTSSCLVSGWQPDTHTKVCVVSLFCCGICYSSVLWANSLCTEVVV